MLQTEYIILRRTPFQESSLVVSGLSPDYGRLDFLLKGALGNGAKKFPYAGLFRILSIEFKEQSSEKSLRYMKLHEYVKGFDSIANYPEFYLAICEYAKFLLKYIRPMLEMPETYLSLQLALERLSHAGGNLFDLAAAKLIFLRESGLVPDVSADDPQRASALNEILSYGLTPNQERPAFHASYQQKLIQWIESLCRYAAEM